MRHGYDSGRIHAKYSRVKEFNLLIQFISDLKGERKTKRIITFINNGFYELRTWINLNFFISC